MTRPDLTEQNPEETATLRAIDAAANRAGEGLRVVEDYVRFAIDDRQLTQLCKSLRHDLTAALSVYPSLLRHKARDTTADVGASLSTPDETRRDNLSEVCAAAIKRTQQSFRSLEEFTKIASSSSSAQFESIRYRCYTLERLLDINRHSRQSLASARLYVLLDAQPTAAAFTELIKALVQAGVGLIQLRDKTLDDRQLLDRARLLSSLTAESETLAIINDRPDLAALCRADGVHLGQEELSVKDARTIIGPRALVGVSTHNLDQARQAVLDGADYLGAGPTFASQTKSFDSFSGLKFLSEVASETTLPAYAIGGITVESLPQVLATGVHGVAVSSAITQADAPRAAARLLIQEIEQAQASKNTSSAKPTEATP